MIECKSVFLLFAFLGVMICLYGAIGYFENNSKSEEIKIEKDAKTWLPLKKKCQKLKSDEEVVAMKCGPHSIEVSKAVDDKAEEMNK